MNDSVGNTLHSDMALQVISTAANGTFGASYFLMQISNASYKGCAFTWPREVLALVQNPGKEEKGLHSPPLLESSWVKMVPGFKRFSFSSSLSGRDPL